ncbi:MAG: hypothetical protein KH145_04100 [Faecalibacterium prausnitzii]|nr:hypothetical protein [Faecalibacterium prausnitzii]
MKRWTRKFLAGLLSFGMLLQVASPLSALAAETPTVKSSITVYDGFSRLYTSVTYVLNRYTDGSVRWEDDKNPWDGVAVSYDTSSNTYVFSGTLSVPAEGTGNQATLICSDPQNDSIKIDGGDGVAVNTSLQIGVSDQTRGAKNVTVLANSNSTAINGSAAFDCYGDVTITNPSGAVTSQYDGIVVYDNAKDIVITGKSEAPLIGGSFSSFSRGNITIENPDGADVRTNLSIREGAAEVKLTGSDSSGLVLFRDSSLSTFKIKAKTLTMENKSGPVGPVEFTGTDTASAYRVAVGESESNNTQTALTGTTYSETVNAKYLRISTDGFVPAPATPYGFSVNGTSVTAENAGTTLPDGMTYDKATNKLTATKDITDDLTIEVTDTALKLDVSLQSVTGDVTLLGVNDVAITGTVNGMLTVGTEDAYASGNVTVNGQLLGGTEINCIGNVKATGSSNGGILKTKDFYQPDIIRCNGAVYLENAGKGYTTCSLTVIGATDVTVKANGGFHAAISGEGDITCSGTVTLTTTGVRAMGSNDPLTYTPMQGDSYTVQLDDQTPFTRTGIFKESEVNLLKKVKSIIITPADSTPAPGPDDGDTTPDDTGTVDSGSDAGGAVAAVLVGGAAVWGGYEIATRVVLHNILPEGTAIPANRGQLALLVWNNAGRPEPAAQPAFADVADADMAKAAQWCVEQGIMEAKTAETFKPEGWIPKFKVIEVWNKAFPKQ